jgi:hypothetical protein
MTTLLWETQTHLHTSSGCGLRCALIQPSYPRERSSTPGGFTLPVGTSHFDAPSGHYVIVVGTDHKPHLLQGHRWVQATVDDAMATELVRAEQCQ